MWCIGTAASPLGGITLASDGAALTGLWFDGQKHFGAHLPPDSPLREDLPVFQETRQWLGRYFQGQDLGPTPPLSPEGTPFQREVWALLSRIPYGQVTTYRALAQSVAQARGLPSMSAQAVGGAVGRNPISILIPCHRVVGSRGSLTGYAGGLEKKAALLSLERADLSRFAHR